MLQLKSHAFPFFGGIIGVWVVFCCHCQPASQPASQTDTTDMQTNSCCTRQTEIVRQIVRYEEIDNE